MIIGVAIFIQPRRESAFRIANILWLFAMFGLTHGLNEFMDMFGLIEINKHMHDSYIYKLLQVFILTISYLFLFEFGRRLLSLKFKNFLNKWVTVFLCIFVIVLMYFYKYEHTIWPRYFLGLPGGLFTALGLIWYYYDNKNVLKPIRVGAYFVIAAISLCVYGVLGGIVVPKSVFFPASVINTSSFLNLFGVPVQVFRAGCAVILAWSVWNILAIFNWEIREKLRKDIEELTLAKDSLDNILNSMIDSLIVADTDLKIKTVNSSTLLLLGYNKEEIINMPFTDIFINAGLPVDQNINKYETCIDIIKRLSASASEGFYKARNKNIFPVYLSCSLIKEKDGHIEGCVMTAKDITEFKNMEEQLKDKIHGLEIFQKASVDRELRIIELKAKIAELEQKLQLKK